MLYPKDLSIQKFGRLKPVELQGFNRFNVPIWKCICDCGKDVLVSRNKLVMSRTKSCGCYRRDYLIAKNTTHGFTRTRFYRTFRGIRTRCNLKSGRHFKDYGGRGIKCEWTSFEQFKKDMYESYCEHVNIFGEKQTSIDRINVNGNYSKENCRWATAKEQANNKRKPVINYCICLYCSNRHKPNQSKLSTK